MNSKKILLVGDNPFQGVSHLSQERARERHSDVNDPEYCASLVKEAMQNGAGGFMFSISQSTLSILSILNRSRQMPRLYAIAPAASDYVRLASRMGTPGLITYVIKQIIASHNYMSIVGGVEGVLTRHPADLMKAYICYELYRIKSATTSYTNPYSLLLHEIVTEMGIALNLEWLFKDYIDFLLGLKIKPGFVTRNFSMLIERLTKWGVDLTQVVIVAPFNAIGFQMCPSREACEKAELNVPDTEVIAMSALASGYLKIPVAIDYINHLPQLKGIVVGISNEQQAHDFKILREAMVG